MHYWLKNDLCLEHETINNPPLGKRSSLLWGTFILQGSFCQKKSCILLSFLEIVEPMLALIPKEPGTL